MVDHQSYAAPDDDQGMRRLLKAEPTRRKFDMRPSIRVSRRWTWQQACELDGAGPGSPRASQVHDALGSVLAILDQLPL